LANQKEGVVLESLPEVVCVKESREFLVHVDNMHIPFAIIPNNSLRPLPIPLVPLNVDAQAPVHLEPQQHLIINWISASSISCRIALHALKLQLAKTSLEVGGRQSKALSVGLSISSSFGGAEFQGI
jgi:hypothetical protein